MFRYCLFDLDGTLTDPKEGITRSVEYALNAFGIQVESIDELEPFIGPPLKDSFMEFYGFSEQDALKAIELYRDYGCILAVASSKPIGFVCQILEHFNIKKYFKVIVGSELDGTRGTKEEVVEEALNQLGILGKTSMHDRHELGAMIGDRKFDMEGAKAYGLTPVGVSFGYAESGELAEAGAEFIADNIEELEEFLLR